MKKTRTAALLLALCLFAALLSSCSQPASEASAPAESAAPAAKPAPAAEPAAPENSAPDAPAPAEEAPDAAPEAPSEPEPVSYTMPLSEEEVSYSFWVEGAPPFVTPHLGAEQSYNTAEVALWLAEQTNVHIEYTEVDMFSKSEKFNLMVASGEYPDMISGMAGLYSGGADQALADGVIIDCTDYVSQQMPAYSSILAEHPDWARDMMNDSGRYLYITGLNDEVLADNGAQVRLDWLEQLGMDVPVTYDDWYEVGKAFKTEFGCEMAFFFTSSLNPGALFSGGYDLPGFDISSTGSHFYQVDGVVHSAYVEDNMKDFLKMLNKWYSEGLLSPDFYNREQGQDAESTIFMDNCGIFFGPSNYIDEYNANADLAAKGFHCTGVPITVKEEGQITHFSTASGNHEINSLCISSSCENVDTLVKWLDYQFTEEGFLLNNYGMEGKSFSFDENGDPQYLPEMFNTEGMNFMQMSSTYVHYSAPAYFDADRRDRVTLSEEAMAAKTLYNTGFDGAYDMPSNLTYTPEETDLLYGSISDVDTYAATYILKFVLGDLDIDAEWDAYVAQLYTLGLQNCLDAKQSSLERYLAR